MGKRESRSRISFGNHVRLMKPSCGIYVRDFDTRRAPASEKGMCYRLREPPKGGQKGFFYRFMAMVGAL